MKLGVLGCISGPEHQRKPLLKRDRSSHSSIASFDRYTKKKKNTQLYKHKNSHVTDYKEMKVRAERTEFLITLMTKSQVNETVNEKDIK